MISTQDRMIAVELINEARENGARLKPACEVLNITDRTYQRWTKEGEVKQDQRPLIRRPRPKNKITEEERTEIIETVNKPEYADLTPSQIVPTLATEGIYIASESTFYRVLREEKLNTHRSRAKVPVKREPPTHVVTSPNEVWTWDITWLNASVKGQYYKLYLILDMFSRLIVGHEVWKEEKAEHAEHLIRKATLAQGIAGRPLVLHSDNGSPMKAATFQATLEKLGVQSSFSRPRVSNDNPYSESLFKTMKYRPGYPFKGFTSLEESRIWVDKFVKWYNHEHLHSGINFLSPYQRHFGLDKEIMEKRIKTYEEAKLRNPERWSGEIRDWSLPEYVTLNPMSEVEVQEIIRSKNYGLPDDDNIYIHRSGRTGRAGKTGICISIAHSKDGRNLKFIERRLGQPLEYKNLPSGREICERQLFSLIDHVEQVEVNDAEIDPFMDVIFEKLAWLEREELIKRFVAVEFNKFLEYYKDAGDINYRRGQDDYDDSPRRRGGRDRRDRGTRDRGGRDRSDFQRSDRGGRGRARTPEQGFTRYFINIGTSQGLTVPKLIGILNDLKVAPRLNIGKVDLKEGFSFFEVESIYDKPLMNKFANGVRFGKNSVRIEVAK